MPVTVAPAGIPVTVREVVTPAAVLGMVKAIVPDDAVVAPGMFAPETNSIAAGPEEHTPASLGVIVTALGELATVTVVVAKLEQVPLL